MERESYEWNIEVNKTHWWFQARNLIIKQIILNNFKNKKNLNILDMGCGSGANLKMLSKFGKVSAIEPDEEIRKYAEKENPNCKILQGFLPNNNPFKNEKFDLIVSLDVLEHIENDVSALTELKNMLNANGKIIISVPAFQCLFDEGDVSAKHFRRYNKKTLKNLIKNSGFSQYKLYFFNSFLFLPVVFAKIYGKITKKIIETNETSSKGIINKILFFIMSAERFTYKVNLIGISLCAVMEKENG